MEVTADRAGVACLANRTDATAGKDGIAAMERRGAGHVGVEVAALLSRSVDEDEVAVEDRVIAGAQHPATRSRDQRRAAGGDDVEALVGAAATAGGAELTDVAAGGMRPVDREDVLYIREAAVRRERPGGGGDREKGREEER